MMAIRNYKKQAVSVALASALSLGAFAAPFSTSYVKAEAETIKVQLLGVNDLHGQIDTVSTRDLDGDGTKENVGGIEYTASYLKQREAEQANTLIVHSGDMVGGSPLVSASFQDEPTIEVLEAIGFDAGTLGNHEFDEGIDEMLRMVNGGQHEKGTENYDGIDFPMVAANVVDKSTGNLLLDPYTVKEVGGAKIGFIGVMTQETPLMIVQDGNENLQVTDEVEAINKYTKELKDQGVRAIVVLAHNPTTNDNNNALYDASVIAEKADAEVDVIFAAHNHVKVNKVVNNKLVVQAYSYGTAISDVDLEIDAATGDIVKKSAEIVDVDQADIEPDEEVKAIVDKYAELVKPIKEEVVNATDTEMTGKYPSRGAVGDHGIGNMIADGMKAAMDADFAMMNGGGVRSAIDAGPITVGDLFAVQPFGNVLNKVSLTGAEIEEVLNRQIDPVRGLDFLISGFKYTWNGKTNKVVDVMLPNGTKLDKDKEYSVVVNNYMYGNPSYKIGELAGYEYETGPEDLQATIDFVRTLPNPVNYKAEGRISEVTPELVPFTDVQEGHWAYEYVTDLREKEIVLGTTPTTFSPDRSLTRSQFASLLVRSLGMEAEGEAPFKDLDNVPENVKEEIAAAFEAGIIRGTSPESFDPFKPISRAQMAAMLIRAYNLKNDVDYKAKSVTFTDLKNLDAEMKNSVASAEELGFVKGYGDQFKPGAEATRAQSAKVISLFLK
ncbi:5'-nucleotidase C-terminal domain-containing protein [Bacillus infantis]|uniref:5'-nucleotidase C-terminal domain-containing protein n=2 Tax=Bacillus TaxID=1386 RepID=UPI003CF78BD5